MALPSGSSPTSSPRVALVRQGRQVVAAVAQAGGSDVVLGLFGAFQRIFGGAWLGARRVGALNNPDNQTRHPGRANRPLRGPKSPTAVPSGKWSGLTRTRCNYSHDFFVDAPRSSRYIAYLRYATIFVLAEQVLLLCGGHQKVINVVGDGTSKAAIEQQTRRKWSFAVIDREP